MSCHIPKVVVIYDCDYQVLTNLGGLNELLKLKVNIVDFVITFDIHQCYL